ncbi:MAG: hypothetical protein M3458_19175 [Acidobacteriota bacterium]|nr:hypothetical protein [Acidobacteriota bacterium]
MDLIGPLVALGALTWVEWKHAPITRVANHIATLGRKGSAWITDERGAYAAFSPQLRYRDFYAADGIVETADGYLWTGGEVLLPSTDCVSDADTNALGEQLNICYAGLPVGTWVQTINRLSVGDPAPFDVPLKLMREAPPALSDVVGTIYPARLKHLAAEMKESRLRTRRTWVYIGRQAPLHKRVKVKLRELGRANAFIDYEWSEYERVRDDVRRARDKFAQFFRDAGGLVLDYEEGNPGVTREVMRMAYERLNPERARAGHPCPEYDCDEESRPRELICLSPVDVRNDILRYGRTYAATLSMHGLPKPLVATTLERFLRSADLTFDVEVATHYRAEKWLKWAAKADKIEDRFIWNNADAKRVNRDEQMRMADAQDVQRLIREQNELLGSFGFGVSVYAPDEETLRQRCDTVITELRLAGGIEAIFDNSGTLLQNLSTLPCAPHTDGRTQPMRSAGAAYLSGWTGGPSGLPREEATILFQRPDGGVLYYDQTTRRHGANQTLVCGRTRSGKSVLMNQLRENH